MQLLLVLFPFAASLRRAPELLVGLYHLVTAHKGEIGSRSLVLLSGREMAGHALQSQRLAWKERGLQRVTKLSRVSGVLTARG